MKCGEKSEIAALLGYGFPHSYIITVSSVKPELAVRFHGCIEQN
jgi:hypothetical protein